MEHLIDITDTFIIPSSVNGNDIITEEDVHNLIESSIEMLDNFVQQNISLYINPKFKKIVREFIDSIVQEQIESVLGEFNKFIEDYEEEIAEWCDMIYEQYFTIIPDRCMNHNVSLSLPILYDKIDASLKIIDEKNDACPAQRTEEWYTQRHNMLSASSIWKAMDSQANQNALIVDKCKPIKQFSGVNINSPFHWGQKYEPLSTMLYEHMFQAKINEYGCIPHSVHKFLGASPDGINVAKDSVTYGRMLEIKNIVNREITGIPKKEYWVQTQLQMEVCDLELCDFFETRFKEYETEAEFYADGESFHTNSKNNPKGVIMFFYKDNSPHYEYFDLYKSKEEFEVWEQKMMNDHKNDTWVKNLYWYLDQFSCVCVHRNREWFAHVLPQLENIWDTIVKERISGYDHRLPRKRGAKKNIVNVHKLDDNIPDDSKTKPKPTPTPNALFQNKLIITIDTS
jgi:putative phage-type endonuclease